MEPADMWSNDTVQFARLLAEIRAAGLSRQLLFLLRQSMDLENAQIAELFTRAEAAWEKIKERGYVYKTQMRWGDAPVTFGEDKDYRPITEHTFFSIEELNAFNEAVDSGEGWFSGEQVIECDKHEGNFYPIDEDCVLCGHEKTLGIQEEEL